MEVFIRIKYFRNIDLKEAYLTILISRNDPKYLKSLCKRLSIYLDDIHFRNKQNVYILMQPVYSILQMIYMYFNPNKLENRLEYFFIGVEISLFKSSKLNPSTRFSNHLSMHVLYIYLDWDS